VTANVLPRRDGKEKTTARHPKVVPEAAVSPEPWEVARGKLLPLRAALKKTPQ
jgi:hypothetical protein